MKRITTTLFAVAAIVLLGSCRAPVFISGYIPLSINVEVPADLSSDVPTAVRKAMADEIRGAPGVAASRFIHPDASYAVATIEGEGVELTSDAVPVSAGSSSELSFTAVPVRSGLTLTVRIYDETGAIVGERVVSDISIDSGDQNTVTVGVLPYAAIDITVGASGEAVLKSVVATGASCYVFKAELSSPGLFSIRGLINGDIPGPTAASMALYDTEGQLVSGYVADPEDLTSYGLFVNESDEESTYYLVYSIGPDWSSGPVGVEATQYTAAIAVYGKTSPDDTNARLLAPNSDINFGTVGNPGYADSTSSTMQVVLRNLSTTDVTINGIIINIVDGSFYGTFSLVNSAPVTILARKEETIEVMLAHSAGASNVTGEIDIQSTDAMLDLFELSLSGYCAC